MLGSQVKTRWVIVGQGAKSYQTQVIFHQIVQETVVLSNDATLISNMRAATKESNVVLNMVILPGITLIPSNLLILDSPFEGYNNVLTVAKKGMQFGKNDQVNFSPVAQTEEKITPLPITQEKNESSPNEEKSNPLTLSNLPKGDNHQVMWVLGSSVAFGSLVIYFLL